MKAETRQFNESSYGEAFELVECADSDEFDAYAESQASGAEVSEEAARPFAGIIDARVWLDDDGAEWAAFLYDDK